MGSRSLANEDPSPPTQKDYVPKRGNSLCGMFSRRVLDLSKTLQENLHEDLLLR